MNILILGGGVFLGRYLVEGALERGHSLTLFNRGRHTADLFPAVEQLVGDRDGGLSALEGRRWDAVVDTCGYVPRLVRASAALLEPAVQQYIFISSISVYDAAGAPLDEATPVGNLQDPTMEEVTGESYGPLKALCESEVGARFAGRSLVVRPGLIVGPHDPTDRFTYWPARIAAGGTVLAPGRPDRLVQCIDVRDLAAWILEMVEQGGSGVFNVTGPHYPLTMRDLLETCCAAGDAGAALHWVDDATLLQLGAGPWMEIPLWIPDQQGDSLMRVDCRKALAAGLRFRPLAHTVADTLAWQRTRPSDHRWAAGMSREREAELLRAASAGTVR